LGIVLKQSSRNTLIIFVGFAIGGVNTLFLYTDFLTPKYYGLVVFLLSASNLLMPLTAFGVQYTIVKFFTTYKTKLEKDRFLSLALFLPLLIALIIGFLGTMFYEKISDALSKKNEMIKGYTFVIYLVSIATAYFEVFYAWSKVHMKSIFGNAIKELYHRISVMILLLLIWMKAIDIQQFIWLMTASYFLRMLLMAFYAFKLYTPNLTFALPGNYKEIMRYSGYIILAGSASAILLDIDKVMLPQKEAIELAAYYTVGVFIASVIEVPGRAMSQILQPITSKALQENNKKVIVSLYKKSSINLLLFSGLIFLLINTNIEELYKLVPKKDYSAGIYIVLMISIAKLYTMALGNNGAIISNSKYYKVLLPYAIGMSLSVILLNNWLIDVYGMNGAALSTLMVILVFNTIKLWYVKHKFGISPFSRKTITLLFILGVFYAVFSFLKLEFHPIINILLKSALIVVPYVLLIKKLNISTEISDLFDKYTARK